MGPWRDSVYRSRFSAREAYQLALARERRVRRLFTHLLLGRLDTSIQSRIAWPPIPRAVSVPDFRVSISIEPSTSRLALNLLLIRAP